MIKKLNELGALVLAKYPYVNSGGCCVFAAAVGAELQAKGIESRVIVAAWRQADDTNLNDIRPYLAYPYEKEDWTEHGIWFNHVGLEFFYKNKRYHYDAHGVRKPNKWKFGDFILYKGWLSIEDATALADESKGWSKVFARRMLSLCVI